MISKVLFWGPFTFFTIIVILVNMNKRYQRTAEDAGSEIQLKPHIEATLQYRTSWQRIAYLIVLSIGVIAEDLVIRGYLILFLGATIGYKYAWALLSIALSIIIHLYQGRERETVLTHALVATLFAVVSLITWNIFTIMAGHLYFDIVVTRGWWKMGEGYLSRSSPPADPNHPNQTTDH